MCIALAIAPARPAAPSSPVPLHARRSRLQIPRPARTPQPNQSHARGAARGSSPVIRYGRLARRMPSSARPGKADEATPKPHLTAGVCAVIKGLPHRWQSCPRSTQTAATPYLSACRTKLCAEAGRGAETLIRVVRPRCRAILGPGCWEWSLAVSLPLGAGAACAGCARRRRAAIRFRRRPGRAGTSW